MPDEQDLTLTSDTLLPALRLTGLRRHLRSSQEQQNLFDLLAAYVTEHHVGVAGTSAGSTGLNQLPARVPGTSLHLRLSKPSIEEIRDFVAAAVLLATGTGKVDASTLTVAAVVSVRDRVRRARVKLGERCVVEVVVECSGSAAGPVLVDLFGQPCRYPRSDCRYMSTSRVCEVQRKDVDAILTSLEGRDLLVVEDAVDPPEYRVVV